MEPRIDLFTTDTGSRLAKRFAGLGQVIDRSPLPKLTRELVSLRASQINGCGWCLDMHAKEAAAAGETAVRLALVALINAANRLAVIVHQKGGSYEAGMFAAVAERG
jgi:AhpD family alkylhydroperoxidase